MTGDDAFHELSNTGLKVDFILEIWRLTLKFVSVTVQKLKSEPLNQLEIESTFAL